MKYKLYEIKNTMHFFQIIGVPLGWPYNLININLRDDKNKTQEYKTLMPIIRTDCRQRSPAKV